MEHQNSAFSEDDCKKIKSLSKTIRGINTPLIDEAKTCKKAFRSRKNSRGRLRQATVNSLVVAYKAFILSECDDENRDAFMEALGTTAPKTSGKRMNAVIKATTTNDRKYASKLANIIKFAIQEKIPVDRLQEFIADHGGIVGCIKAYTESNEADEDENDSEDLLPKFLTVNIQEPLIATIQEIIEEAKKSEQSMLKYVKLCFYPSGEIKLRKILKNSSVVATADSPI